jgi:predicted nucleotidyltransferase
MGKRGIEEINEFLKRVEGKFMPERVILFGSRGRGDYLKHSDYDIIIVSSSFEGIHFLDRLTMLFELWDYDFDLDILAYTPKEFEEKKEEIGVVNEAVREGVELEVMRI